MAPLYSEQILRGGFATDRAIYIKNQSDVVATLGP